MKEKLRQIVSDATGVPLDRIGEEVSMADLAEWDSVTHLNIVISVEQQFGTQFSAAEVMELRSLPAFCRALQARGAQ